MKIEKEPPFDFTRPLLENGFCVSFAEFSEEGSDKACFTDYDKKTVFINKANESQHILFAIAFEYNKLKNSEYNDIFLFLNDPVFNLNFDTEQKKELVEKTIDSIIPKKSLNKYGKYANQEELATLFFTNPLFVSYQQNKINYNKGLKI